MILKNFVAKNMIAHIFVVKCQNTASEAIFLEILCPEAEIEEMLAYHTIPYHTIPYGTSHPPTDPVASSVLLNWI